MKEILNVYTDFPFDRDGDEKDLFEHYGELSLLISQIGVPLLERLNNKDTYHIVITRTTGERS